MLENIKPWFHVFLFLFAIVCLGAGPSSLPNQPADWKMLFTDDFEDGSADGWAVDVWGGSGAGWEVIKDGGNWVFSGRGHSTAKWLVGIWSDFRFKARIKLVQGGVFINYRTNVCDRYFLDFHPGSLALNRSYPCGSNYTILSVPTSYNLSTWYTLEVVGIGANLKVFVDGVKQIDFTDPSPLLFGGISLEANPDSQILFDDVEVSGPLLGIAEKLVWVKTGGPIGGLGYDVRMRPDNPDILYVTDTFSGVNISEDSGHSWKASNLGILTRTGSTGDSIPVFSLTIDPHDNNVIWVGTQNVRGIYKSTDGGQTWSQKDKGIQEKSGISFRGFTVDPKNPNIVYAAGEISSFAWAGQTMTSWDGFDMAMGVVYKTIDRGENWNLVWRGDSLARYIWIDPRNSNVLYVSTGIFDRAAANCDSSRQDYGGVGIIKSIDAGRSWRSLGIANGLTTLRLGSLFMHPQDPDILLAGGGGVHASRDGGVFLSTNGGETWIRTLPSDWMNFTSVEFALSNPQIAYATGEGAVYRSEDGGYTWKTVNGPPYGPPGIRAGVPIDIQVDPRNADRLFINNYNGGNFLSEDGGRTWTVASQGYTGAQMHKVAVDSRDPKRVFAVGRSGIYRSLDGGDHWEGLNYLPLSTGFGELGSMALDPGRQERLLLSPENEGMLMLSTTSGAQWNTVFRHPDIPQTELTYRQGQGFLAIAYAPSTPNTIYAGMSRSRRSIVEGWRDPTFGIFKSTDGGASWQATNDANSLQNINALVVDPWDDNVVYAGTLTSGILKTADGGGSWRALSGALRNADVRSLAIDPGNPSIIYTGLENGGLYKSIDAGAKWTQACAGMDPNAAIRDIAIDPTNPQIVYAADLRSGVYRSEDGGKLWVQINKGLSTRAVKSLALSSDGSTLYAATDGEGVFRLDTRPPTVDCTYTISSSSEGFASSSALGSMTVTSSSSSCSWGATSNDSWITITSGSSSTGSGTVTYSVAANTTGSTRTGTMTVAGLTITITQTGFNAALYFPHIDTSLPWQTEIAVINTSDQTVTGTLRGLSNDGQLIETRDVTLPAHGRRQITVANEFTNHLNIGYIIFDTNSAAVRGYTKFYQTGIYRAAIPAVKEVNTSDIYISHIDSSALWWTGVSLVNTTSARKDLTITFNDGQSVPYALNANQHRTFTIGGLLDEPLQPDIRSAVITNANGVIGLELFGSIGSAAQMDGILLTDKTASTLYYPHVASGDWWTGIVAYNPAESAATITITPYSAQGTLLATSTLSIAGKGKYVGIVAGLGLPAQTAWFRIDSTRPLSGFELFGTVNGNQVAAYAENGGTGTRADVFAKIEKNGGWTGIAFVNTEDGAASVTLTAYNDSGTAVATQVLPVGGHEKVVNLVEAIFMQDISGATYIAYSSDRNVVGFQLNGSSDGMMLDGLPGLGGAN